MPNFLLSCTFCVIIPFDTQKRLEPQSAKSLLPPVKLCHYLCCHPIHTVSGNKGSVPFLGYVSAEVPAEGVRLLGYTQSDADADYALIMGDNSMKPVLYQEDYIFLKNTQSLSSGEYRGILSGTPAFMQAVFNL